MEKRVVREHEPDSPLSEEIGHRIGRRSFLWQAGGLGLALPVIGGLAARAGAQESETDATSVPNGDHESDAMPGMATDGTPEADGQDAHNEAPTPIGEVLPFQRYDPVLAPVQPGDKQIALVAKDIVRYVAKDVVAAGWSYDGTIPGRPLRVTEGDRVSIAFSVDASANAHHSLDTHAAKTPPDQNFRTIKPGEELSWTFTPRHPGAFMYHCGTPKILMHIGSGMYGPMIVDPKGGWPPAQELILVQSEIYLKADASGGIRVPDYEKMLGTGSMDLVVFNGHASQYVDEPIPVRVGEPVRIFVVNCGPNVWSSFHVVGTVFDAAYVNGNPTNKLAGLQSISVGPGDGACVEFTLDEPGTYPVVNHAFGHAAHGAVALLRAS